jgi:protein associated with RNAse G/E
MALQSQGDQVANSLIEVQTFKFNGRPHRSWNAELIRREESLLILDGMFEVDVQHDLLGTIAGGTHSLEYYWLDRWYNVFRFSQPNGELRNYYCNINVPPTFDGKVLSYVDLDLDILVAPDFSYQVLDVEEFERNAKTYEYSLEVQGKARGALGEIIKMIETRQFPFSD